ncbi:hybrid sensor histidine kinase/response regulator [Porticoccus sp. W117]|uniref:ATP-binding response regulator n=1 Tax=Porticoccus sp. W117 TaxID=3054777 RepID=UPI0025969EFD|nr:hybrid sensor histidine kinase/response regulator [Porticoccus sp. W117]MDM3870003.1 hybrid sensor histidine kinase/response regulator [Porticoccus sp. W117]
MVPPKNVLTPPMEAEKYRQLIDILARQTQRSSYMIAPYLLFLAWLVSTHVPAFMAVAWCCTWLINWGVRVAVLRLIDHRVNADRVHRYRELAIQLSVLISGLILGSAIWLFDATKDIELFALLFIAIAGMPAGAAPTFSARPHIWQAYAYSILGMIVANCIYEELFELAALTAIYALALTSMSRDMRKRIDESISLGLINQQLVSELTDAKEEAERSNLAKSQFLASASHDLRQPLHAMGILLENLKNNSNRTPSDPVIDKLMASKNALSGLFNSLLDLSQLDSGAIKPQLGHYRLSQVFESIETIFTPIAHNKQLSLVFDHSEQVVYTDLILLERVLHNLVSNAIKFTEEGNINITASGQENLRITVTDTGIGIPSQDQQRIFDEYLQLNNDARDRSKGIGLGLAVVKRLCTLLGCELSVESTPGRGSRFQLTVAEGDLAMVTVEKDGMESPSIEGLKILMIDDDQPILDAMSLLLNDWNCSVWGFTSKAKALAVLQNEEIDPDVLICDYRLKGENGIEVIDAIRSILGKPIPALIISGDTAPEITQRARQHKLFFLNKPVKSHLLANVLARITR